MVHLQPRLAVRTAGGLRRGAHPADLRLGALGTLVDGNHLTTAWYQGAEERDEVFELPSDFFVLDAGVGYGPARSAAPPDGPLWAWRWTRDEISNSLKHVLKEPVPTDLNPEMLKRYPGLKDIVPVAKKEEVAVPVRKG